ncbi:hypothetical protein EDB84DRAFT_1457442 [Lactarius hengduanensis]|nr:hypothetical protein EDB84DRAFT_1457442 [Lactarius hengduanensis]
MRRSRSISQFLFLVPRRASVYARWTRDINPSRTGTARCCLTGSLRMRQHEASRRSLRQKGPPTLPMVIGHPSHLKRESWRRSATVMTSDAMIMSRGRVGLCVERHFRVV